MATKPEAMFQMSDADIANMVAPPEAEASGEPPVQAEEPAQQEEQQEPVAEEPAKEPVTPAAEDEGEANAQEPEGTEAPAKDEPVPTDEAIEGQEAPAKADPKAEGAEAPAAEGTKETPTDKPVEGTPAVVAEAPNYEESYKQIMAPLKANGKTIDLKTPEEAIALMQMGANYTRKMQEIAPHRKTLLMLENAGVKDDAQLSFLIDLSKHDPAAIQKLIKDSGINPLEIDTESESTYLEGNHAVTDVEVNFRSTIDELNSTDEGKATIQVMNGWDRASKDVLWEHPELMSAFHEQKQNGVYDTIAAEVERRQTLGIIPTSTSFIHAYQAVGNEMAQAAVADAATTPTPKERVVLETKAVAPKPVISNADKADAASPTRSSPRKAQTTPDFLKMSDEDFMKQVAQFEGRL